MGRGIEKFDVAAMSTQDALGDGEAEAGAFGAVGEEGVKDLGLLFLGDTVASVANDKDSMVFFEGGLDLDGAAFFHCLGGVENEVENDLLDLAFVDFDAEAVRVLWLELNLDFLLLEFEADKAEGVCGKIIEVAEGIHAFAAAAKAKNALDDFFELVDFFGDDIEVGLARVSGLEVEAKRVKEEFDDGEGVADLVGDFGGQHTECGEFFVAAEGFFGGEDAAVESSVVDGDRCEAGEGGEDFFLVVVESVGRVGKGAEYADGLIFKEDGSGEHGDEAFSLDDFLEVAFFGKGEVRNFDLPTALDGDSDGAFADADVFSGGEWAVSTDQELCVEVGLVWFEQAERAGMAVHELSSFDGEALVDVLEVEFAGNAAAEVDEGFELVGFGADLLDEPEFGDDAGGFVG